tara:strand:- start:7763 stop:8125 length:363 start_codon:yes stop_codon:yes gene_type:complete
MKHLALLTIAILTLSSCTENTVKNISVTVTENGEYMNKPAFSIHAEYTPDTFGEKIEEFAVEIIVTGTPADTNNQVITKVVTLTNKDFTACNSKMVHGLGYYFDSGTTLNYSITHTHKTL